MRDIPCKSCGGSRRELILDVSRETDTYLEYLRIPYRHIERHYFRCKVCGLIYRSPILDDAEKALLYARFRDFDLRNETAEEYFLRITSLPPEESENREKLEFLSNYITSATGRLLDVGCGAGVFLYSFKQHFPGWQVSGVEPTNDFPDVARAHGIEIASSYLQQDTFSPGFDLVSLIHVVEHLDRPLDLLGLVKTYLRPGGLLYVECPSERDLQSLAPSHDRFMCQHDVIHSEQTLRRLIVSAGFRPTFTDTFVTRRRRNNTRILAAA